MVPPKMSERHEVRVPGDGQTIVFVADSDDRRLIIRQEREGQGAEEVCSISLSNPQELRSFFNGLRRIVGSLGQQMESDQPARRESARAIRPQREAQKVDEQDREAL